MESKIKTFIFDFFGVICDPVLNSWYKDNRLKNGLVDGNIHNIFRQFNLGIKSEDDIVDYFLKYDGVNVTKEKLHEDLDNYLKIDKNLVKNIEHLKSRGYKTILLSNGNNSFFEKIISIKYPNFRNCFDEIIISSVVGLVKPDAAIYLHALQKTNSKPEETLFIDDHKVNVDGAKKLGINSYLYTDSQSFAKYINSIGINLS